MNSATKQPLLWRGVGRLLTLSLFHLFTLSPLILSSCIDEFEADIPSEDSDMLVVEGTICSGKQNTFILSRTLPVHPKEDYYKDIAYYAYSSYISPYVTTTHQMVMGAIVSVRGSDGSEYKADEFYEQSIGYSTDYTNGNTIGYTPGYYTCWIDALNPDVEYYLHIECDGDVYESVPQKPLRTEKIAEVSRVQNTPESNIDVLVTPAAPLEPGKANYYSWTYEETWEVRPDYTTDIFFDVETRKSIFKPYQFPECGWLDATSSTIMVGGSASYEGQHIRQLKLYDLDRNDERVYHRYSGLIHQRAISKAEYEYELARRQAGSEMGGLFTPQPSSLPTNIHCLTSRKHVIGFVGCSLNTSEYRFFIVPKDFSINRIYHRDTRIWLEDCNEDDCCQMVHDGLFLCIWEDDREMPDGVLTTAWAYEYQLDVRKGKGAYITEPEFWSLTEDVGY